MVTLITIKDDDVVLVELPVKFVVGDLISYHSPKRGHNIIIEITQVIHVLGDGLKYQQNVWGVIK